MARTRSALPQHASVNELYLPSWKAAPSRIVLRELVDRDVVRGRGENWTRLDRENVPGEKRPILFFLRILEFSKNTKNSKFSIFSLMLLQDHS